ncbi:MAG: hypothetical protein LC737_11090, partial [Chloroflexi bacterium]|nr:hypothetical protein [Chloroflexota bacterium]
VSRTPRDRAIVNLAMRARLDGDVVRDVRIAAGGIAATSVRLAAIERALEERSIHTALPDPSELVRVIASPPSDHIASADYRRAMIAVLMRRAIRHLGESHA